MVKATPTKVSPLYCLYYSKISQCIHYGGFLIVGADADFPFWLRYLIRTFVELDTQLVPHLGNVEGVDIEAVLLFDIGLEDGIGGN